MSEPVKKCLPVRKYIEKIYNGSINRLCSMNQRWMYKREFKKQHFHLFNERPVEFAFVFKHLAKIYPHKILDVGAGKTALPSLLKNCGCLVTAIDNIKDYWPAGMINQHYYIIDDDITKTKLKDKFDLVTCISVLEHVEEHSCAVGNMFKLLNPRGYLILTFPYSDSQYVNNVYKLPGSKYGQDKSYITQSFSRNELNTWLADNNGIIVEQEFWQFWKGDFWTVGEQIIPPVKVNVEDKHQVSCILIQKNE